MPGDVYRDDIDYDRNPRTGRYESFFRFDYLVNMGEVARSSDTDGDGYINVHNWEWFDHFDHVPAWHDLQWLPFRGRLGTFWCQELDGSLEGIVGELTSICALSPRSPFRSGRWKTFENNVDCGGFGNRDTATQNFKWIDAETGRVVCDSGR